MVDKVVPFDKMVGEEIVEIVKRCPCIQIGGTPFIANRYILKRTKHSCVYVHEWLHSDPSDLHDHPWDNTSLVLTVGYWEFAPLYGSTVPLRVWHPPGSTIIRKAEDRHRIELDDSKPRPWSLFITGPEVRQWGFHTAEGFQTREQYRGDLPPDHPRSPHYKGAT